MKILILTNTDISNKDANGLARIICNYLEYLNNKNKDYKIINLSDKSLIKRKKSTNKIKRYILSFVPYVTINKYYSHQQIYNYIKPYLLSYDKVQIFGYALDYKVLSMIKKLNIDVNLILIDSLTLLRFRSIIYTFNLIKLPINIFELIKCFNYEIYSKQNFNKVSYVSKVDANFISCFTSKNTKINVISNGVDLEYYRSSFKTIGSIIRLIFYGDLNYKPNKDCVNYIVNKLNNLLLKSKSMPKYEIFLIGKSDEINYLNKFKNVKATGFADDLRKYFNSKTIFICPMRTGVGVKNKVLESIAMEVPIVGSPLSCAGISSKIHKYLFISNNENVLKNYIIKISRNYEYYNRNSSFIKQFLKEEHSWDKISNKYYYS